MLDTTNINIAIASLLIEECLRQGLTYFCLSPGSRSTPLAVAIAQNPRTQQIVAYDERGAAFHALGYGRATGRAAVLICTSGTAVGNYLPAILEADVDHVPMLVISADRPPELRQTMANQTLDQVGMFGRYVRWFFDLPCPSTELPPPFWLTTLDQAIFQTRHIPGPVHLNLMFRDPLEPTPQPTIPPAYWQPIERWQNSTTPYTDYLLADRTPSLAWVEQIEQIIAQSERGLLVIGQLKSAEERHTAAQFAQWLGWPTFADITSGLRLGQGESIIGHCAYWDQALLSTIGDERPDTVIHIGGQLVSKRLSHYLQRENVTNYLLFNPFPQRHDPTHQVSHRFVANLSTMLSTFIPRNRVVIHNAQKKWGEMWINRCKAVENLVEGVDNSDYPVEIAVTRAVTHQILPTMALFLGSSMPIRDADMYGVADGAAVPLAANRGASGIDGTIACALGFAVGHHRPTTLLCGDLTFLHDINSLTLLRHPHLPPLTIVLINNHGGGIFHLLPIRRYEAVFEPYFGTPHAYSFHDIAHAFGLRYEQPTTMAQFRTVYASALAGSQHTLIEVVTDREENQTLHQTLQATIRAHLS